MNNEKYEAYEREKRKIQQDASLTYEQHEQKIKELARRLGV